MKKRKALKPLIKKQEKQATKEKRLNIKKLVML